MSIFEHINKRVVIGGGAALLIVLILLLYFFSGRGTPHQAVTRIDVSPLEGALGRELLATLARLKSTKLDTSIFSDPVFVSLRDFGVEIAPQPVGRRNPFASFDRSADTPKRGSAGAAKIPAGSAARGTAPPPPSAAQEEEFAEFQFE